jgi:AAHS family 4-hydroxybenzoate transporter-like MFS transporter
MALPESPSYLVLKGQHQKVHSLLAKARIRVIGSVADAFHLELKQEGAGAFFGRHNARMSFGMWIAYFCVSLANYTIAAWLTVILVDMHLPLAKALRGPETFAFSAIIGALAIGWLIARLGSRCAMLALSFLTIASGVAIGVVIMTLHGNTLFAPVFAGLAVLGFCMGGLQPAFYVLAASVYPTHNRTTGVGVVAAVGRVGAILSSFVGGAVLALAHASGFFLLIAALAAVVAGGVLLVDQHMLRVHNTGLNVNSPEPLLSE